MAQAVWPKVLPPLTEEQRRISDDFMKVWHEVLPHEYSVVDRFNHGYPVNVRPTTFLRTLEIGAGLGEHLAYEKLTPDQEREYYALELRENMSQALRERFPRVQVVTADCQEPLPFAADFFDRVLAVHVLEHLPNLPATIRELYRVCRKDVGTLSIVIPCEGSLAYSLARRMSAQRVFESRYHQSYQWFIEREHINRPREILGELEPYFERVHRRFFPIPIPTLFCNLAIGVTFKPRKR